MSIAMWISSLEISGEHLYMGYLVSLNSPDLHFSMSDFIHWNPSEEMLENNKF